LRGDITIPRSEAGFTLAEMLVALGVLGLGAGLLASALHTAARTMGSVSIPAGDESISAAQRVLRERLLRFSGTARSDTATLVVDAQGEPNRLSFSAPPTDRDGSGVLQRYRLMLTPGGTLMLYSASSLDARMDLRDPSLAGWRQTPLIEGVRALEVSYFGDDPVSGQARWQGWWTDRPAPPALIRLRVRFGSGDRRVWPDLVVRPQATVNSACMVTPGSGGCQQP